MKVLIIVPTYNEAQSLKRVIDHLKDICPQYDYIIINDGYLNRIKELQKSFNDLQIIINQFSKWH